VKDVVLEALVVAVIGAALAFAANGISPRGLKLTRDFFPTGPHTTTHQPVSTNSIAGTTNIPSPHDLLVTRLREKGLSLVDSNRVIQLFDDPRREQNLVLFVDARDDEHYQKGHIPGAYQLDYFRPENYLATLLPLCQMAEEIVVYCNGGTCEESEFTATFLLSAGLPKEKLAVYAGGISEWETNRLPVETGARLSGQILTNYSK
jgi:rhodanese-related sulfurtransferase